MCLRDPSTTTRILVVEASPMLVRLMEHLLSDESLMVGYKLDIDSAFTLNSALKKLSENEYHGVICDLQLEDSEGISTYRAINRGTNDIPIIVVTAIDDPQLGVQLTAEGAEDYIVKGAQDGETLIVRFRIAFERWRQRQIQKQEIIAAVEHAIPAAQDELVQIIEKMLPTRIMNEFDDEPVETAAK